MDELNFGALGHLGQRTFWILEGNGPKSEHLRPCSLSFKVPNPPESHLSPAGTHWKEPDGAGQILMDGWALSVHPGALPLT